MIDFSIQKHKIRNVIQQRCEQYRQISFCCQESVFALKFRVYFRILQTAEKGLRVTDFRFQISIIDFLTSQLLSQERNYVVETSSKLTDGLTLNMQHVKRVLVDFLRDETYRIGLTKGVLGLSGGVDSAVSAFLAAEAFGPENLLCVMMPYKTSSSDSLTDAQLVVQQLGTRSEIVEITPMVEPYFEKNPDMTNVRRGNVMARQRMIVLYDLSARENALVIGTGNKTENMLGYTTHYGDNACAINPIGDLYKTQVWALAEHLGVPKQIVNKKPSADLWIGQTDEGELGFSYRLVDKLLYQMIDERRADYELIEMGFEENFIKNVRNLIQRNQYKRRPPTIAKISYRTVNVDFRYARDWGT
jgi:NAD+ synthase